MNLFYMTSRMNLNVINKTTLILAFCFAITVSGQQEGDPYQNNPGDKIFLPTPEQASLLKFTDIPPGNHTGVQGFSIPIYTIQGKNFSLPISIDYHGMGIKVNEVSGSVGIGWSLNAGGVSLSQEVRGERDQETERLNAYFNPGDFQPDWLPTTNQAYHDALAMLAMSPGTHGYKPEKEFHPDYFSYSLLNNRGKFMLDNNNKAHTIPKDNVKIAGYNSFVLTDNQGLVYHFSSYLQENATYGAGMNGYGGIVQFRDNYGYKIDYIEIPHSNETITFEYHKVQYAYASSHTVTNKVHFSQTGSPIMVPSGSNTFATVTEYLPKSIEYNQVKINFKYKMNVDKFQKRIDVNNGTDNSLIGIAGGILEYIEVMDKNSNTAVKNYKLNTDYFTSLDTGGPNMSGPHNTTQAPLSKRLKLVGIQELLSDTKYGFEYYGETEGIFLPARFSYKTDYWGMYNGKNNTTDLHDYAITGSNRKHYFPGADKNPDSAYAKIGSLKKVFLPTGGYQEFEYELDEFKNTIFDDDNTTFYPVKEYQEREYELLNANFPYGSTDYNNYTINIPPTVIENGGFSFVLSYETNDEPETVNGPMDTPIESYFYLELYDENGQHIPGRYFMNGEYEISNISPQYHFKLIRDYGSDLQWITHPLNMTIHINLKWVDESITYPQNRNAGTLRVKSITLNDESGSPQIKRSYNYRDFDNPSFSSGKFTGRPLDRHYMSHEAGKSVYNISNNDIYNLSHSFGKSVVYKNVTETYESTDPLLSANNHKKEYEFQLPDPASTRQIIPLGPFPHMDYTGGFLLKERIKDNQNKLLRLTTNEYYNPDFFFNQFSGNYFGIPGSSFLSAALFISASDGGNGTHFEFDINGYYLTSAWIKLKKTTVEEFENNALVRSNYTEYNYNENTGAQNEFKSILPVSTITGTSLANGAYEEKLKTVYKYPQDLIGLEQTPYMQQLKDANIITEPVMTETYLIKSGTEKKLSETHTKYGANLLPSEIHARTGTGMINLNTIEDRKVRYSKYDSNGNIMEYILEDGTPVAVVWGYNGQYPIAKVEGKTYAEILSLANVLITDSNASWGLQAANFENLRNLSGALVTSYIYKPLVGITTMIEPNGQVQYYTYDSAGRLEEVYIMEKDSGGNPVKRVLKKTKYNYQP